MIRPIEIWAGVECTVNRVHDTYHDQLQRTGHDERATDLDLLAGLGVRRLRYPVLWERCAPNGIANADWSFPDERLARLRSFGVQPIVGLVHHGSGPRDTSLLDEAFPQKLAEYALAVARRYPWVTDYTPINEPLTTARFSALYGHWYPHHRDPQSFVRALLIQTRATLLAMAAIRSVVPNARLVQTEDIGTVSSTAGIAYQAVYENHRRFLSLDLLFGRVRPGHALYRHLRWLGVSSGELAEIASLTRPPDLIGVNYYVTSDRFLDERVELYPEEMVGGNGRHRYVDTEAVRAHAGGIAGHETILRQVWARYRTPLALTEVHLGCSPEEQLRWLAEAWRGANAARTAGADVRALTLWSAFGAYDWSSLVTEDNGHYEPGIFDVSEGRPRPTPLAAATLALARRAELSHPCLPATPWWRCNTRFAVAAYVPAATFSTQPAPRPTHCLKQRRHDHRCRRRPPKPSALALPRVDGCLRDDVDSDGRSVAPGRAPASAAAAAARSGLARPRH